MGQKEQKSSMSMFAMLLSIVAAILFAPVLAVAGNLAPTALLEPTMKILSEVELGAPMEAGSKVETKSVKENTPGKFTKATVQETYEKSPLCFIQNHGQVDAKVKFYVKGAVMPFSSQRMAFT